MKFKHFNSEVNGSEVSMYFRTNKHAYEKYVGEMPDDCNATEIKVVCNTETKNIVMPPVAVEMRAVKAIDPEKGTRDYYKAVKYISNETEYKPVTVKDKYVKGILNENMIPTI